MANAVLPINLNGPLNRPRELLARRPWLLPVATWIVLYAWRPIWFGFYHDDWSLLLGCGSILAELYCVDPSRPGAVMIRWAFHQLIGADPTAWQCVTVASAFGAAWTLMLVLQRLLPAISFAQRHAAFAAALAASFYLAFPWMLGLAWVNGTSPNFATIGFNLAVGIWFARWPLAARCVASAACFALAGLVYEAFWFAFLPFALLLWLAHAPGKRTPVRRREQAPPCESRGLPRRDLAVLAATLAAVQLTLIAFNRIVAFLGLGANKSFDADWLQTLGGIWPALIGGLRDIYGTPGRYLFAALLVALLAALATRFEGRRATASLAAIAMGIALSFTLLAAAGYVVQLTGLFARTTLVLSWWLAVAAALAAALVPDLATRPRRVASAAGLGLLAMCAGGTLAQSRHWITSWAQQKDILAKLPRAALLAAPAPSLLVVAVPRRNDGVGTFHAWWDISSAIWLTAPDIARHLAGPAPVASPIAVPIRGSGDARVRIARDRVTQSSCAASGPVAETTAAQTLLWRYPGPAIEIISAPVELGCADRFGR